MKVYVASSWRNDYQPEVVAKLRTAGHEVYDFRHPAPGDEGFHWSEIDPKWQEWDAFKFRDALSHPVAEAGYGKDYAALVGCDACVMVLPCGRSAHTEAALAAGMGKRTCVLLAGKNEPELMYKVFGSLCLDIGEVVASLSLQAWCNGYETVAANSENEARDVVRAMEAYDPDDLDGDGWSVLSDSEQLRDEDGKLTGETVGAALRALGKPGHLWSCEV